MAIDTLPAREMAKSINHQLDRLMMLGELTRLTIESLPNNSDSDVPSALLTGMQEMLGTDIEKMHRLSQTIEAHVAALAT